MARPAPRVFTIPPGTPFLPTFADALLSGRFGDIPNPAKDPLALADVTILVPTRRAARSLHAELLVRLGGRAAILPAIRPIGDVDEEGVPWTAERWSHALDPFYDDHDEVLTGAPARGPALFQVTTGPMTWRVRQLLDDPEGDHDWRVDAVVDLTASDEAGAVVLRVLEVGAL